MSHIVTGAAILALVACAVILPLLVVDVLTMPVGEVED